MRREVIHLIFEIARSEHAFDILEDRFSRIPKNELSSSLLECGIIPESLEHDSSEEKLWAKFCDILLAHAWTYLSIPARVLRARGDSRENCPCGTTFSADVFGETSDYTIVGDAKAFRLSRTAKNQKDFKIRALDDWRKSNTYACRENCPCGTTFSLVSPLYQYPKRSSQIYQQAIERNVTLLSYTHLRFLLDHYRGQDLSPLWRLGKALPKSKNAQQYWEAVDETSCEIIGESKSKLEDYKQAAISKIKKLGKEGIDFWKAKIDAYRNLSQQEAVAMLIKAERIEAKIQTIRRAIDIASP